MDLPDTDDVVRMPERVTPPDPRPGDEKNLPLKNIVEAILFVTPQPLPLKNLCALIGSPTQAEVLAAIRELQNDYIGKGVELAQVAGGFRFFSREEYAPWAKKVLPEEGPSRLSRAALEALSVIAYRQPITRVAIEEIRGVNCDGVIRSLLERKLITTEGREDAPGRPFRYRTTKHFLLYFGLSSLEDLPPLPEGQADEMDKRSAAAEAKEAGGAGDAEGLSAEKPVEPAEAPGDEGVDGGNEITPPARDEPAGAGAEAFSQSGPAVPDEGEDSGDEEVQAESPPAAAEVLLPEAAESTLVGAAEGGEDFTPLEDDLAAAPSEAEDDAGVGSSDIGPGAGSADKVAPEE